jgi:hypothetical protein
MKRLSSRLLKMGALATLLVSGMAGAYNNCNYICNETGVRAAEGARASVLTQLSKCDQYASDPAAYNACAAPIYAQAQSVYNTVYAQASNACGNSCH